MDRPANDLSGTRLPVVMARTWSGRLTSSRRIGRRTWRPVKGLASWRMTAGRLTGIAASAPRVLVRTGSIDRWCNHRRDVVGRDRGRIWLGAAGIGDANRVIYRLPPVIVPDQQPGYGRLQVVPGPNRPLPPPAQSYRPSWSSSSAPTPADLPSPYPPTYNIDAVLKHGNVGPARDGGPKLRERRRGAHRDEQGRIADTHEKPVSGGGECNGGVRENSFKTGGNRW